jgi:hypothetical protein
MVVDVGSAVLARTYPYFSIRISSFSFAVRSPPTVPV